MSEFAQWEYRVETVGSALSGPKDEDLTAFLDEWGEEGWEVISAYNPTNSSKVRVIAKRPLARSRSRQRTWPGY
jgi:hypothetical protein